MLHSTSPNTSEVELRRTDAADPFQLPHPPSDAPAMRIEEIEALLKTARDQITTGPDPVETSQTAASSNLTLDDLGDIDLDISIELGRAELLIEDVLKLREGSVVSLDQRAGDPVDIVANGRLIARGELLVVDGKFGVRLSEVL